MDTLQHKLHEELTERLENALRDLARCQSEHEEAKDNARFLELTNQHLHEKILSMQKEIDHLTKEITNNHREYADTILEKDEENSRMRHDILTKLSEITLLEHFLQQRTEEYEQLVQELSQQREHEKPIRINDSDTEEETTVHHETVQQFVRQSEMSQSEIVSLKRTNQSLKEEIQIISQHMLELEQENEELRHVQSEHIHEIETLNAQMNERNEYIYKLEGREDTPVARIPNVTTFASESMSLLRSYLKLPFAESEEDGDSDWEERMRGGALSEHDFQMRSIKMEAEHVRPTWSRRRFCGMMFVIALGISGSFLLGYGMGGRKFH